MIERVQAATDGKVPLSGMEFVPIREFGSVGPVTIAVCGLSHHSAPIEILEKHAFTPETRAAALTLLTAADVSTALFASEAVILSTCNRVELYVASTDCDPGWPLPDEDAGNRLAQFLADYHGLPLEEVAPYLYSVQGEAAIRHLFEVAAGLDSLVLGEPQILGQVRGAIDDAQRLGASGPLLSTLFRRAIETGKRVHTETNISQGAASVSYAAVEVAARHFADLGNCKALIVGAGRTGQLTAQCLAGRGMHAISVANRSYDHAADLAQLWSGTAYTLDELALPLSEADIVISCTNAPGYVITRRQVELARAGQAPDRPLLLLDLAVPRDIDLTAARLPGVTVYNVEDLRQVVETNLDERRQASLQAQSIIEAQVASYISWLMALNVTPVITDLRQHAEAIRQRELAKARNRLGGTTPDYVDIIETVTQRIINQLLHEPTVRLKQHATCADGMLYAQAVRELFALDDAQDRE